MKQLMVQWVECPFCQAQHELDELVNVYVPFTGKTLKECPDCYMEFDTEEAKTWNEKR